MTARSTRRAAETAVINEAVEFVGDWNRYGAATVTKLARAVKEYEGLGLAEVGQPAFSNNSTDTSAEAGASIRHITGVLALRCYDEIAATYRNDGVGLTVDALEQRLQGKHQTISARVNELRNAGWVIDSGIRRKTRSGRPAIVWTPSQLALKERT